MGSVHGLSAGPFFFKFNGMDDASSAPNISKKKWCIACFNPEFSNCGGWKNRVQYSFIQKSHFQPIFDPKHLENTLETLLNHFMATKKPKNSLKTRIPPRTKILFKLIYVVLGVFKVKQTPPSSYDTFWYKNQLFWWSKSSPTTTFSL